MADNSKIEWCDTTWNVVRGCSRVSEGCRHCFAERFASRGLPGYEGLTKNGKWTGDVRFVPEMLDKPLRWKRPRRIFVNSMSDLFHESLSNETIAAIFGVMAAAPQHTFQVLTKRPQRMREWFAWVATQQTLRAFDPAPQITCAIHAQNLTGRHWTLPKVREWPLPNVWLGVSVENQAAADERIPLLLETPAAVRFLSCEPLLDALDLDEWLFRKIHPSEAGIDWVIAGGESGPGARPMHIDWARSLRDQCQAAGVPYFHKQNGEWIDVCPKEDLERSGYEPKDPHERWVNLEGGHGYHGESVRLMRRVGKKLAGSLLDGVEHKAFPGVANG